MEAANDNRSMQALTLVRASKIPPINTDHDTRGFAAKRASSVAQIRAAGPDDDEARPAAVLPKIILLIILL